MCDEDGRRIPYMCANETSFNQKFRVCDWNYNVDCASSPDWYLILCCGVSFSISPNVVPGTISTTSPTELTLPRAPLSSTTSGGGRARAASGRRRNRWRRWKKRRKRKIWLTSSCLTDLRQQRKTLSASSLSARDCPQSRAPALSCVSSVHLFVFIYLLFSYHKTGLLLL